MKQVPILAFILVLTLVGFAEPRPVDSRAKPSGFSLFGIQPGSNFVSVRGWKVNEVSKKEGYRTVFLQNSSGAHLLLKVSGSPEVIRSIGYFPINSAFKLELDGKPFFEGIVAEDVVRRKLKAQQDGDEPRLVVRRGGQVLIARLDLKMCVLHSLFLESNDSAGAKR